jgi:hypothetical protein
MYIPLSLTPTTTVLHIHCINPVISDENMHIQLINPGIKDENIGLFFYSFDNVDELPETRYYHCAALVTADLLFVAGGITPSSYYSDSALLYSVSTGEWEAVDDMPTGRRLQGI